MGLSGREDFDNMVHILMCKVVTCATQTDEVSSLCPHNVNVGAIGTAWACDHVHWRVLERHGLVEGVCRHRMEDRISVIERIDHLAGQRAGGCSERVVLDLGQR